MAATAASDVTTTNPEDAPPTIGPDGVVRHPPPPPPPPNKAAAEIEQYDPELEALSTLMNNFKWSGDAVESCARAIMNPRETHEKRLNGLMQLKQLLCTTRDNVFQIAQDVIDSGVLKALVHLVSADNPDPTLRLPAAFCLTNIAAGHDDQTAAVVHAGAIPPVLNLLRSREEALRRQAIFCLANIAGSTPEYRGILAQHKDYFSAIIYAVDTARDPKMEELAAWNIRNMCVLGGPKVSELREGLDYFADQILRYVPQEPDPRHLIGGGLATLSAVLAGPGVAAWARGNVFTPGTIFFHSQVGGTPSTVRFATETFSLLSRSPDGRAEINDPALVMGFLFHAKYNGNQSVRNHTLETLSNICEYGTPEHRQMVAKALGIPALGEVLADWVSYTPNQRILTARILMLLANDGYVPHANAMTERVVMTRDIAAKLVQNRKEMVQQARSGGGGMELIGGSRRPSAEADWSVSESRALLYELESNLQRNDRWFGDASVEGASVLEISYSILAQLDRPEEFALREKCGRIITAILARVSEAVLWGHLTLDLFKVLLDILELAVEVDLTTMMSEVPTHNGHDPGANAIACMTPGEPYLALGAFVMSVLTVLERLLQMGEDLQVRDGSLENPMAVMLQQMDGLTRLEAALVRGVLPQEAVHKTIQMVQKYCR